jgi:hypothetical protein
MIEFDTDEETQDWGSGKIVSKGMDSIVQYQFNSHEKQIGRL